MSNEQAQPRASVESAAGAQVDYLGLVLRHLWLTLAVVALSMLGTFFYLRTIAPLYRSTALIDLDTDSPNVLGSMSEGLDQEFGKRGARELRMNFESQYRVIAGRAVAEDVVTRLALRENVVFLGLAGVKDPAELRAALSRVDAAAWQFYLLLVLSGCVRAFAGPARGSLLPLLVPRRNLENADNWNSGFFQAAAICGPIATGLAIDAIGSTWQLYIVAAGLTASLAVVAPFLRPEPAPRATEGLTMRSLVAGARFIVGERVVFGALLLDLLAVLFGGATALLPMYADEILHIGQKGFAFGVLKASPYVGALIMAAVLASRPPIRRAGPALLWSVAGFGACMVVFGLSTSFWIAALALVTSGALDAISVTIRHMLVQTRTPNELRGRVSAVNTMFIECSNELGSFESGLVARWMGPVFSVVSGGIGTLLVVGVVAARFPSLRRLRGLTDEDPHAGQAEATRETNEAAGDTTVP